MEGIYDQGVNQGVTVPVTVPSPVQDCPSNIAFAPESAVSVAQQDLDPSTSVPQLATPVTTPWVLLSPEESDRSTPFAQDRSSPVAQQDMDPSTSIPQQATPVTPLKVLLSPEERDRSTSFAQDRSTPFAHDGSSPVTHQDLDPSNSVPQQATPVTPEVLLPLNRPSISQRGSTSNAPRGSNSYAQTSFFSPSSPQIR